MSSLSCHVFPADLHLVTHPKGSRPRAAGAGRVSLPCWIGPIQVLQPEFHPGSYSLPNPSLKSSQLTETRKRGCRDQNQPRADLLPPWWGLLIGSYMSMSAGASRVCDPALMATLSGSIPAPPQSPQLIHDTLGTHWTPP